LCQKDLYFNTANYFSSIFLITFLIYDFFFSNTPIFIIATCNLYIHTDVCLCPSAHNFQNYKSYKKKRHTLSASNFSSIKLAALLPASFRNGVKAIDNTTTIISSLLSSRGSTPSLLQEATNFYNYKQSECSHSNNINASYQIIKYLFAKEKTTNPNSPP